MNISMDMMFNLFKMRFDMMDEELFPYLKNVDKVNIFIDFESLWNSILIDEIEKESVLNNENNHIHCISNIINVISHYRLFMSKHKIFSKIFIYCPKNPNWRNMNFNPEYRYRAYMNMSPSNTKFSKINNMIKESIGIVETILTNVDSVYWINVEKNEPATLPMYIKNNHNSDKNIIITRDEYHFQYPVIDDSFIIVYPKGKKSKVFNKTYLKFFMEEKYKIDVDKFNPDNFILMKTLIGDKYRGVPKVIGIGWKKAVKLIGENYVDNPFSIKDKIKPEYWEQILNNWYSININEQIGNYSINDMIVIDEQLIDNFDSESLKLINDKYFIDSPIMLEELTSGDRYKNKHKIIKNPFL